MKKLFLIAPLALLILFSFNQKKKASTPNIVIIFMDDLGYGDVSCFGSLTYRTPAIDRMAAEGMRFTNFLAAQAVCSASRAGLLTGTYPNRIGFSGALDHKSGYGLNENEQTIAELLKQKDYATAIFGKWHLGITERFLPLNHGFDEYTGLPYSNDMWPVDWDGTAPAKNTSRLYYPRLPLIEGNTPIDYIDNLKDQEKLTTLYTEKAVDFIKRNKKKPFFLYLPHSMAHVPIAVSEKFAGKSGQGLWADMMLEVDWSVNRILTTLKEQGLDENTIVIFTSDNGPWLNFGDHAGSAGGFREGKGTSFEGGQRVPTIIRWPGHVPAGTICNQLASTIDLLPTIAEICKVPLSGNQIDGVSLEPLLDGNLDARPRRYFAYYYQKNSLEAVRRDQWKLVLPHEGRTYEKNLPSLGGLYGKVSNDNFPMALYDLRRDPNEAYDVQELYPEIVAELLAYADKVRADLGDDITGEIGSGRRKAGIINP